MKTFYERYYPYLFAVLAGVAYAVFSPAFPKGDEILSSSITVAAIFTGFLATTKSMAISLDTPAMVRLRSTQYFDLLIRYLKEAINVSLLSVVVGVGGFFFDASSPRPLWYGALWSFFMVSTFFTFTRVTNALLKLMALRR